MTGGYTRDPSTGLWYHPKDGGIYFDPQRRQYFSARRQVWSEQDTGPWPDAPANGRPAQSTAPVPWPHVMLPPGRPGAANCVGAPTANEGEERGADALLRLYQRLPLLERVRFLRLLDETEQAFNGEFVRRFSDAPLDRKGFALWVKQHPDIVRDLHPTTSESVANRGANAGTIRGRRR